VWRVITTAVGEGESNVGSAQNPRARQADGHAHGHSSESRAVVIWIEEMREFIFDNIKHVLCVLILGARLADIISTYLATPSLRLEANPLVKRLGWSLPLMSVIVCVIPYWSVGGGIVVLVVSLWAAADNIARLWFIHALGESAYHDMIQRALDRGSPRELLLTMYAKTICIMVMGSILCVLAYASPEPPLSFWFGVGILSYGFIGLWMGMHRFRGLRKRHRILHAQPAGEPEAEDRAG
jgi:hypothetical protein